jgi:hypothetical protein
VTLLLHTAGGTVLTVSEVAGRSIADAGLARARYAVVLVAPKCGICLEQRAPPPARAPGARAHAPLLAAGGAPDGNGWTCRAAGGTAAAPQHYFCRPCLQQYLESLLARSGGGAAAGAAGSGAEGSISGVPVPSRLRCPQPGCPRVISDADFSWLLGEARLATYRVARASRHAGRLAEVTSGREGGESMARWVDARAQACPQCAVLIERGEGCRHMQCLCGAHFYWQKAT